MTEKLITVPRYLDWIRLECGHIYVGSMSHPGFLEAFAAFGMYCCKCGRDRQVWLTGPRRETAATAGSWT